MNILLIKPTTRKFICAIKTTSSRCVPVVDDTQRSKMLFELLKCFQVI